MMIGSFAGGKSFYSNFHQALLTIGPESRDVTRHATGPLILHCHMTFAPRPAREAGFKAHATDMTSRVILPFSWPLCPGDLAF